MFNQDVEAILEKTGLKKSEAQVYLTLLQTSNSGLNVAAITKKTNLKRSTVNLILDRLAEKGFVSYFVEDAHKVFAGEDPSKVLFNLQNLASDFKSIIPLLTTSNFGGLQSKVRFFEGEDTINRIHRDILLSLKYSDNKKELLAFSSGEDLYNADPNGVEKFVKDRVKNDIVLRWIAPDNQFTRNRFVKTAEDELRQVKFFDPKEYPFHIQINIYGSCVALISLKGNKSGAIIENQAIADSFRALFNLLWDSLRV
jgi:sugar-specific transcriptional regulator TrmB